MVLVSAAVSRQGGPSSQSALTPATRAMPSTVYAYACLMRLPSIDHLRQRGAVDARLLGKRLKTQGPLDESRVTAWSEPVLVSAAVSRPGLGVDGF